MINVKLPNGLKKLFGGKSKKEHLCSGSMYFEVSPLFNLDYEAPPIPNNPSYLKIIDSSEDQGSIDKQAMDESASLLGTSSPNPKDSVVTELTDTIESVEPIQEPEEKKQEPTLYTKFQVCPTLNLSFKSAQISISPVGDSNVDKSYIREKLKEGKKDESDFISVVNTEWYSKIDSQFNQTPRMERSKMTEKRQFQIGRAYHSTNDPIPKEAEMEVIENTANNLEPIVNLIELGDDANALYADKIVDQSTEAHEAPENNILEMSLAEQANPKPESGSEQSNEAPENNTLEMSLAEQASPKPESGSEQPNEAPESHQTDFCDQSGSSMPEEANQLRTPSSVLDGIQGKALNIPQGTDLSFELEVRTKLHTSHLPNECFMSDDENESKEKV